MNPDDIDGLYYITHIDNLESICQKGIFSHARASQFPHTSIAKPEVIDLRKIRSVPQGRPLLEYVNLYFNPRNPMMYKVTDARRLIQQVCILKIKKDILNKPRVVISDGNAASDYTRFYPSPAGLARLNHDEIFVKYWKDEDLIREYRLKNTTCAEVLVPDHIEGTYIDEILVPSETVGAFIQGKIGTMRPRIDKSPFFG